MFVVLAVSGVALVLGFALFGVVVLKLFQHQMRPFPDWYYEECRKEQEILAGLIKRD